MNTDRLEHIVLVILAVLGSLVAIKNLVSVVLNAEPSLAIIIIHLAFIVGCVRLFCITREENKPTL